MTEENGALIVCEGGERDFEAILPRYREDFPLHERKEEELLKTLLLDGSYRLLILNKKSQQEILGYAFLCQTQTALWLDYLAVANGYRGMGLGSYFFQAIPELCENRGMFLEVEMATSPDPILRAEQQRRISFYEGLGAQRLAFQYLFPTKEGAFPMHLYFKGPEEVNKPSVQVVSETLSWVFHHLHEDVPGQEEILAENLKLLQGQLS